VQQLAATMTHTDMGQLDAREIALRSTTLGSQKICERTLPGCTHKIGSEAGFAQFWALKLMAQWVAELYTDNDEGQEATAKEIREGGHTMWLSLALGITVWDGAPHDGVVMSGTEFGLAKKTVPGLKTYTQQCYKFIKGCMEGAILFEKSSSKRQRASGQKNAGGAKKVSAPPAEFDEEGSEDAAGGHPEEEDSGSAAAGAGASSKKGRSKKSSPSADAAEDELGEFAFGRSDMIPQRCNFITGDSTSKEGWVELARAMSADGDRFNIAHRAVVFTSPPWGFGFGPHDTALGSLKVRRSHTFRTRTLAFARYMLVYLRLFAIEVGYDMCAAVAHRIVTILVVVNGLHVGVFVCGI
jgi:hypothetical protein